MEAGDSVVALPLTPQDAEATATAPRHSEEHPRAQPSLIRGPGRRARAEGRESPGPVGDSTRGGS